MHDPFDESSQDAHWPEDATIRTTPVSDGFVDRAFRAVRDDQRRIADEAARVDDEPLDPALLARLDIPEPSPGFVEATLAAVQDDRRARREHTPAELGELLDRFSVPAASPDFVSRTLDALRVDRSPLRVVRDDVAADGTAADAPRPARIGARSRFRVPRVASLIAAALLVALFVWAVREPDPSVDVPPATAVALDAAQSFTPTAVATAFSRQFEQDEGTLRFEPGDALLLLADAELASLGGRR